MIEANIVGEKKQHPSYSDLSCTVPDLWGNMQKSISAQNKIKTLEPTLKAAHMEIRVSWCFLVLYFDVISSSYRGKIKPWMEKYQIFQNSKM